MGFVDYKFHTPFGPKPSGNTETGTLYIRPYGFSTCPSKYIKTISIIRIYECYNRYT